MSRAERRPGRGESTAPTPACSGHTSTASISPQSNRRQITVRPGYIDRYTRPDQIETHRKRPCSDVSEHGTYMHRPLACTTAGASCPGRPPRASRRCKSDA
eukprot:13137545-Alexandrium_andersonii.AAC.1